MIITPFWTGGRARPPWPGPGLAQLQGPGGQQGHGLGDVAPGGAVPTPNSAGRLAIAQVGQHQQRLWPGPSFRQGEPICLRWRRRAGGVGEGLAGQRQRGRVERHLKPGVAAAWRAVEQMAPRDRVREAAAVAGELVPDDSAGEAAMRAALCVLEQLRAAPRRRDVFAAPSLRRAGRRSPPGLGLAGPAGEHLRDLARSLDAAWRCLGAWRRLTPRGRRTTRQHFYMRNESQRRSAEFADARPLVFRLCFSSARRRSPGRS